MIESPMPRSSEAESLYSDLCVELQLKIIEWLPAKDLLTLRQVNRHFYEIISDECALLNSEEVQRDIQNPILGAPCREKLWRSQEQEIAHFTLEHEKLKSNAKIYTLVRDILIKIGSSKDVNTLNLYRRHKLLTQLNESLIMEKIDLNDTKLSCKDCLLTRFPEQLFTYPHLKIYWQNLKHLDLDNNKLMKLPSGMMKLPSLSWLRISNNKLTCLSSSIGNLKSLKWLYLDHNELQSLPNEITGLAQLTTLSIQNNHISLLPENLSALKQLLELNAQNNNLHSLPDGIHTMRKLMPDFRCNDLHDLPEAYSALHYFNSDSNQPHSFVDMMSTQRAYTASTSMPSTLRY